MEEENVITYCNFDCKTFCEETFRTKRRCQCFPHVCQVYADYCLCQEPRNPHMSGLKFRCYVCAAKTGYEGGPCVHNKQHWWDMCERITHTVAKSGKISAETVSIWYQILTMHENPMLIERVFFDYQQVNGFFGSKVAMAVLQAKSPVSNSLASILGFNGEDLMGRVHRVKVLQYARHRFMFVLRAIYLILRRNLGKDLTQHIMLICRRDGFAFHTNEWKTHIQPRWFAGWQQLLR
jgi:hypothetical protein